jgi:hypothetical protein
MQLSSTLGLFCRKDNENRLLSKNNGALSKFVEIHQLLVLLTQKED